MVRDAEALKRHLTFLRELRGPAGRPPPRLEDVKRWQSKRLAATYADIAGQGRYGAATRFFLEDLYAAKDFSGRDKAMLRVLPLMARTLPAGALETAALAIELEALSEDLDHRLAEAIAPGPIDGASYAKAYRESSTRAERERQIALIGESGRRLDALVKKPLVFQALKLMRKPAQMAGMSELQDFLERGFTAFRAMRGADDFLALIDGRERDILN